MLNIVSFLLEKQSTRRYNAVYSAEKRHFPSKSRLNFNELHGVISQKTEQLFITTGVRISYRKLFIYCTHKVRKVCEVP
jgi:hypothetical protein